MPVSTTIVARPRVTPSDIEQMLALHREYYCGVDGAAFKADLAAKDWVILLRDARSRILGFSTMRIVDLPIDGAPHRFLFSGDTVVDQASWQRSTLAGAFGHVVRRLLDEPGRGPIYWFLISKGYRTYRFLPVFFREFFPRYDMPTPPAFGRLLAAIGAHVFAGAYDASAGIVRHAGQRDFLKPALAIVPTSRRRDPHVRFFVERNPRFDGGDELACIAPLEERNFLDSARRVIARTEVVWDA
jgi:hypothetical protein